MYACNLNNSTVFAYLWLSLCGCAKRKKGFLLNDPSQTNIHANIINCNKLKYDTIPESQPIFAESKYFCTNTSALPLHANTSASIPYVCAYARVAVIRKTLQSNLTKIIANWFRGSKEQNYVDWHKQQQQHI